MPSNEHRLRAAARARAKLGDAALTLDEIKLRHIARVLAAADGHVGGAAIVLGVRRQSLQRMMKRLPDYWKTGDRDLLSAV